ncbi:PREDICTED: uncharacterized protein LOC102864040 [Elephantulus edwardii]|uniref:uncharacterized protein LOC102864040 n=1 Tax=Elephantulus edwardii TaxID=28737 RepID=UPI0003F0E1B4|nr:PREDICTED: uncharacterized protein LOC102864040 [Elephantulus edwardii]
MGPMLLYWVALCLLGAGPVGSRVTQTPKYVIKGQGQQVILSCSPVSGHNTVYWFQHVQGQSPKFLVEYFSERERSKGDFPERFSGRQFSNYHSELNLSALELGDTAMFLCASSKSTALQGPHRPVHKPPALLRMWQAGTPDWAQAAKLRPPEPPSLLTHVTGVRAHRHGAERAPTGNTSASSQEQYSKFPCNLVRAYRTGTRKLVVQRVLVPAQLTPAPGQGLEFLMYFQNKEAADTSGMPKARFSAERPEGATSTLSIQPAEPGDSAVYLCASSLATEEHSLFLPVHKPRRLSPPSWSREQRPLSPQFQGEKQRR